MCCSSHIYARVAVNTDPILTRLGDLIRWLYIGLTNDYIDIPFQVSSQSNFSTREYDV